MPHVMIEPASGQVGALIVFCSTRVSERLQSSIVLAPPADILHDLIGVEFECPVRSQAPERTSRSDEQLRSGVDLPELGIGEFQVPLEVIPRASVRVCQVVAHGLPSSLLALARKLDFPDLTSWVRFCSSGVRTWLVG